MHFLDCPSKMWSNIFAFIFFCVPLFWGFRWIEITCADRNFVYFESCCFCAWGSSTQLDFWLSASKYIDFSAGDRFHGLSVKTETGETKRVWEGSRPSVPHMHGWSAYSNPPGFDIIFIFHIIRFIYRFDLFF